MDSLGRDERKLLERGVTALEKLAEDPVLQIESGPPICPFCKRIAEIKIEQDAGEGPLAVYVIVPECLHCHNKFFAVPLEWAIFTTQEEAEIEIEKRAEVFGVQNGG
jgi:hypothetical protein